MKTLSSVCLLGLLTLGHPGRAADLTPLDLSAHVGPSQFDFVDAPWAVPLGEHVMNGVPWKISGVVELWGSGSARSGNAGRTNVTDIPVGAKFERLHLLGATAWGTDDGVEIATVQLHYADGSQLELPVRYGHQVRDWFGPRRGAEDAILDPDTKIVWRRDMASSVHYERGLRLYHSFFANPHPGKEVTSLALHSKQTASGWMLLAATLGSAKAARLTDTYTMPENLVPNERPRTGQPAALEGVVRSFDGQPLAGVHVLITGLRQPNTAATDQGAVDPTDGETATTDAGGRFAFVGATDQFNYELTAIADGYAPYTYLGADPTRGAVELRLKPAVPIPAGAAFVQVRLQDEAGNPVAGARIEPEGVSSGRGTSWGGTQGFPSMVVSNARGEFSLHRAEPFERLQLSILSKGFAPEKIWLPASNALQSVTMGVGGFITGRIVKDGQPVRRVNIGVSGTDRNSMVYAGHYETVADEDGRFIFRQLPPNTSWQLYGLIHSLKAHGAVSPRAVTTAGHGSTNDVGDLVVTAGLKVSGRLVPTPGNTLPAEPLSIVFSYDTAWDHPSTLTRPDGSFELEGIHPGAVDVSLNARHWRISHRNRSVDHYNAWRLVGLLPTASTSLWIEIEPGERNYNSGSRSQGSLPNADQPRNRSLSGVEPGASLILVTGTVVDDATGNPITNFEVLPGRQPPIAAKPPKPFVQRVLDTFRDPAIPWNEIPFWYSGREQKIANGKFDLEFERLTSDPLIQVSAPGFEPVVVGPLPASTNGLVVRLTKGVGPGGVVLLPDGKPAAGAKVIYGASREQFGIDDRGDLMDYGNRDALVVTDATGAFSFSKRMGGTRLFASHREGWLLVEQGDLGSKMKARLEPWAVVTGVLVDLTGAPVANQELILGFDGDWYNKGLPHINFNGRTRTGTNGGFVLTNAPPGDLVLNRIVPFTPVPGGPAQGWSHQLQTRFYASPGVTNGLGKVTLDTPPPEPLLKRLKQKVGL